MGQLSSTGTAGTKQDNLVPTKTTRTYWGKCGYQDPIGQLGLNGATSLHPGLSRQLGQPVPNRTTGAFGITETPRISTRISTGTPSLLGSPGTPGSPLGHLRSVGAPGSAPRPQGLVLGPIGSTGPLGSAPGHCHPRDNQQPHDHPLGQPRPLGSPKVPGSPPDPKTTGNPRIPTSSWDQCRDHSHPRIRDTSTPGTTSPPGSLGPPESLCRISGDPSHPWTLWHHRTQHPGTQTPQDG